MQKVDGRFGMLRQKLYICSNATNNEYAPIPTPALIPNSNPIVLTAKQNTHYQHEKEEPLTFTQLATACSLLQ